MSSGRQAAAGSGRQRQAARLCERRSDCPVAAHHDGGCGQRPGVRESAVGARAEGSAFLRGQDPI